MEKVLKLKFYGIDNFNRPIFKNIEKKQFYGSTDKLFKHNADTTEVLKTMVGVGNNLDEILGNQWNLLDNHKKQIFLKNSKSR